MNSPFIYFISLLAITTATSLMIVTAQENNKAMNNIIHNNTTLSNASLNLSAKNNPVLYATKLEKVGPMNNVSNASAKLSSLQSGPSNETAFMIGSGVEGIKIFQINANNESKPVKDVSKMMYIIQGTPHGYV